MAIGPGRQQRPDGRMECRHVRGHSAVLHRCRGVLGLNLTDMLEWCTAEELTVGSADPAAFIGCGPLESPRYRALASERCARTRHCPCRKPCTLGEWRESVNAH